MREQKFYAVPVWELWEGEVRVAALNVADAKRQVKRMSEDDIREQADHLSINIGKPRRVYELS